MDKKKGRVIYLNGVSSSGKTTIAENFRQQAKEPFLYLGLDTFIEMIPLGYFGFYDTAADYMQQKLIFDDGHPLVELFYGSKGMGLIETMYKTVTNLVEAGMDVVFDDVYWDLKLPAEIMKNIEVYLVSVYAPLNVLEEREIKRATRAQGVARWQFPKIYTPNRVYDMELDTARLSVEQSVEKINQMLKNTVPTAFEQIRNQ